MPTKRAILIFHEIGHFDSSWMTRYLLESVLSFPYLNLREGATPVEVDGYLLPENWVKGLFPVPVSHRLCAVLQLSDDLQVGRTKFYRWKCSVTFVQY